MLHKPKGHMNYQTKGALKKENAFTLKSENIILFL